MKAAVFEIGTDGRTDRYLFRGRSAAELLEQLQDEQDLDCLVRLGRPQEGPRGQAALDLLETALEKYRSGTLGLRDLGRLDLNLHLCTLRCLGTADGEAAISRLEQRFIP